MQNAGILTMILMLGLQNFGARGTPDPPRGSLQRSAEILYFKRFAESGAERGKEIYFYKCWVCHNDYTRSAGTTAPTLRDLYKSSRLISGQPVNDQTVAAKSKNGDPNMPGYHYTLPAKHPADMKRRLREVKSR